MVAETLNGHRSLSGPTKVTAEWVNTTALSMVKRVQESRSTWQVWHLRAEAQRRVRGLPLSPTEVEHVVDHLTTEALTAASVKLAAPEESMPVPDVQRRSRDGASVYSVAGSTRYTSAAVLQAEENLRVTAAQGGGRSVSFADVDIALLESAANGIELNAGQVALVRGMATSGALLQLAIAPAGSGKQQQCAPLLGLGKPRGPSIGPGTLSRSRSGPARTDPDRD
ncbi:hypothetical protein [Ornithinimicrobium sp. INDO-MA30-4]|uniref:hypothetical protein n=1 Tax=Ornithinimicrobium sp. INDO-MA30-4 TaxID=2908651 RepID=UPI001F3C6BBC|nr:hypothetical protein [Ornithinimicrobium sp. INDO-MA30-4]UJH71726.1 hypothetical protein L0A91_16715 [Ornithinimicrobium sp. INDO-MA30-4]